MGVKMKEKKTGQLIGAIFGNIVGIILVNSIMVWRQWTQGVILETWMDILWAANLSLIVQLAGNLVLIFYRQRAFSVFMDVVFSAVSLVSLIVFFIVFPIDFSVLVGDWLNTVLKVVVIVAMGGTLIGFIVNLVRLLTGRWHD
jgi:hypothetical protein